MWILFITKNVTFIERRKKIYLHYSRAFVHIARKRDGEKEWRTKKILGSVGAYKLELFRLKTLPTIAGKRASLTKWEKARFTIFFLASVLCYLDGAVYMAVVERTRLVCRENGSISSIRLAQLLFSFASQLFFPHKKSGEREEEKM